MSIHFYCSLGTNAVSLRNYYLQKVKKGEKIWGKETYKLPTRRKIMTGPRQTTP